MTDLTHATPELFTALAKAQGEIENASKSSTNPHFKSKYADLAEVLNTIRPTFALHGLSLIQSPAFDGSLVSVTTVLAHSSGGYLFGTASCVPAKSDAQGIGAATTYLRRYGAAAVSGIAQEDDDGQSAVHNKKPAAVAQHPAKVSPLDGVWDSMDEDQRAFLSDVAAAVVSKISDPEAAAHYLTDQNLDADEKAAVWSRLDSKVRTPLTKALNAMKEAA